MLSVKMQKPNSFYRQTPGWSVPIAQQVITNRTLTEGRRVNSPGKAIRPIWLGEDQYVGINNTPTTPSR